MRSGGEKLTDRRPRATMDDMGQRIHVRLSDDLMAWLRAEADRERLSLSATVRRLLWEAKERRPAGTLP